MKKIVKDLELPIAQMLFFQKNEQLDIILGTTLGYVVKYENIENLLLDKNVVINNKHL